MSPIVLDASALLAFIYNERGAQSVAERLDAWTPGRHDLGGDAGGAGRAVRPDKRGRGSGNVPRAIEFGLSLGDRACLTLAMLRKVPTLTADQTWARIPDLGVDVVLIR